MPALTILPIDPFGDGDVPGREAAFLVLLAFILAFLFIRTGLDEPASVLGTIALVGQALVPSVISFLKGRIALGVVAIFIPLFGLWATLRLGRPASPWARRFYGEDNLGRARERFPADSRGDRMRDVILNAIGGRPSQPDPPS